MTPEKIAKGLREGPRAIVQFLASWKHEVDGALSAPEIGLSMRDRRIITRANAGEWARPYLNRLRAHGLAKELGWSGNARTWVLTDLGRAVAEALRTGGTDGGD